ncbi:MAG: energy transducer TonB [Sphingomonas sp.]
MTALELSAFDQPPGRYCPSRSPAPAIGAVVVQLLIGYLLITGLAVSLGGHVPEMLQTFTVSPTPPPPPVEHIIPPKPKSHKPDGAASPANLKARPTDLVAPTLPPPIPQTIAAAPKAGPGTAPSAGASDVPGPGTGAGGQGTGTGSGDQGSGDGDGDDTPPRLVRGRIKDSDYPASVWESSVPQSLLTRLTIDATGHVSHCAVTRSSGNAAYDAVTCRLVEQRFRFAPARDAHGKPVSSFAEGEHEWTGRPPSADEREN